MTLELPILWLTAAVWASRREGRPPEALEVTERH